MSGWNYPDDALGPWDGPAHEPHRPSRSDFAEENFNHEVQGYPRGFGPPWRGEDAPSEYGDPHYIDEEQSPDPHRFLADPGFPEHEVDTHHDPDHGREEHRIGAVLRQSEQHPDHYTDYDKWSNDVEHQREHEGAVILTPERTGLEHTVLARRNPQDNGWDIITHLY